MFFDDADVKFTPALFCGLCYCYIVMSAPAVFDALWFLSCLVCCCHSRGQEGSW